MIAIIITIMVLAIRIPHSDSEQALRPMLPVFLNYVPSFVYVGIYWNNHHHTFAVFTGPAHHGIRGFCSALAPRVIGN